MTEQQVLQQKMQAEFTRIKVKNPAFSLRAYAKKLKISPAAVSEIFQGKRKVSVKLAERILHQLGTDPIETKSILALFGKSKQALGKDLDFENDQESATEYKRITSDQFHTIAGWHHFAILSLMETKGFRSDVTWIASRLGIKVLDAETALDRLERLGMIEWDKRRKSLQLTEAQYQTPDEVVDLAIRRSHSDDLELARKALDEVALDSRDFTSITMAVNKAKMKEAKKKIRKFRDELCAFLEGGEKTEVYRMCVHLFPMSQLEPQDTEV